MTAVTYGAVVMAVAGSEIHAGQPVVQDANGYVHAALRESESIGMALSSARTCDRVEVRFAGRDGVRVKSAVEALGEAVHGGS